MSQTYPLTQYLVEIIRARRERGECFNELAVGVAKGAIDQLSPADKERLRQSTEPNKK